MNTSIESSKTLYERIISKENILGAYHDLYKSFENKSQIKSYKALEGQTLFDVETDSHNLIEEVQKELTDLTPLPPVQYLQVPKKNGKFRDIYKLTVKERVKCQAVYRVLEPLFETKYSDNLYSYRSTHPCYYASRSLRRYYLRHYNVTPNPSILKIDIKDYFDNILHDKLIKVLIANGLDEKVIDIVKLFLIQPYFKNGDLITPVKGVKGGLPLSSIFANIYIGHLDFALASKVNFYRRVGDDIILIDMDAKKLSELKDETISELQRFGLESNQDKLCFDFIDREFSYLGLTYRDGKVRIPDANYNRIVAGWRKKFAYKKFLSIKQRTMKLNQILQVGNGQKGQLFMSYARAYNLVNDDEQIKGLSKRFLRLLTIFFTGGHTFRNMNLTKKFLRNAGFSSLTHNFIKYNNRYSP